MSTNGTVKKVQSDRGFGFIAAEDGEEYFFHRSGLDPSLNFDSLAGGEAVTFEVEKSDKGPRRRRLTESSGRDRGHRASGPRPSERRRDLPAAPGPSAGPPADPEQ